MAATRSKSKPAAKKKVAARRPTKSQTDPVGPYMWQEAIGLTLGGLALMLFLAMVSFTPQDLPSWVPFSAQAGSDHEVTNFIGPVGAFLAGYAYFFFGAASYLGPAVLAWWTVQVLTGHRVFAGRNLAAFAGLLASAACIVEFQTVFFQDWPRLYQLPNSAGGFVGYGIGQRVFANLIGVVGATILMVIGYFVSLIYITGLHPLQFANMVKDETLDAWDRFQEHREIQAKKAAEAEKLMAKERRSRSDSLSQFEDEEKPRRPRRKKKEEEVPAENFEDAELPLGPTDLPKPKIIDASSPKRKRAEAGGMETPTNVGGSSGAGSLMVAGDFENYDLPAVDMLTWEEEDDADKTDPAELMAVQRNIVDTLDTFGIHVTAGDITKGPTITRYEIYPSPGLRVNRITQVEADLARATRAERINILAPIPGKDTVGIEIANSNKVVVTLRELFEDDAFQKTKAKIPLALGKDVYGKTIIGDLAAMPHLLVAGATGSGKSVCINSIIASLLVRFRPDQLRFIMVDPKVVEMQMYNDLPHMVVPVVTDSKKVLLALRWVINEMERRYELLAKSGCRNIASYNEREEKRKEAEAKKAGHDAAAAFEEMANGPTLSEAEAAAENLAGAAAMTAHPVILSDGEASGLGTTPFAGGDDEAPFDVDDAPEVQSRDTAPKSAEEEFPESLPYIVVLIDELADLMQTAPADVESAIARIAQKARAAGIHLIVATQTPRADVVTGVIKANIPSRIAFQVSSKIDSRVILDAAGADRLCGKGDMLYLPPGSAQLIRAQGALILDEDVQDMVDFCASQAGPNYETEIQDTLERADNGEEEVADVDEEMYEKCIEVVYQERKASTSLLQRRLRLGYTRAARMMDILEARGIIGPGEGAKPREILVDLSDEFE